jgi:Ca2+-binding RTX toxin-like protein
VGFANVEGSGDTLRGGDGNDVLFGGTGGDTIYAGGGDDLVFGDQGEIQCQRQDLHPRHPDLSGSASPSTGLLSSRRSTPGTNEGTGNDLIFGGTAAT